MTNKKDKPYYMPSEVVIHNKPNDCWLTLLGRVLDITTLIEKYKGERCIKPLLVFAGKDVSHWFDKKTGDIQTYIHRITGNKVPYCPHGPVPNVKPDVPSSRWPPIGEDLEILNEKDEFWWNNKKYHIGYLTRKVRPLRIINMLIAKEVSLNVCDEDTIDRIMERYSIFNSQVNNYYAIRFMDRDIDVTKTLEENGIIDERERFSELGMASNFYIPCLFLYYKDVFDETDSSEED